MIGNIIDISGQILIDNLKLMMSFSSAMSAVTASSPINLTNISSIKTESETEEINGHTAIKRHTIDAILGLPRLGGYHPDLGLEASHLHNLNRSSFSESEAELTDKEKHSLDVDGKVL